MSICKNKICIRQRFIQLIVKEICLIANYDDVFCFVNSAYCVQLWGPSFFTECKGTNFFIAFKVKEFRRGVHGDLSLLAWCTHRESFSTCSGTRTDCTKGPSIPLPNFHIFSNGLGVSQPIKVLQCHYYFDHLPTNAGCIVGCGQGVVFRR